MSDEDEEEIEVTSTAFEKNQKAPLYPGSKQSVKDFSSLFMGIIDRLGNLPATQCEDLLEFIRIIIPEDNHMPDSYYKINKSFYKSKVIEFKLCSICQKELNSKKKCPSQTCVSYMSLYSLKPIKVFILDM